MSVSFSFTFSLSLFYFSLFLSLPNITTSLLNLFSHLLYSACLLSIQSIFSPCLSISVPIPFLSLSLSLSPSLHSKHYSSKSFLSVFIPSIFSPFTISAFQTLHPCTVYHFVSHSVSYFLPYPLLSLSIPNTTLVNLSSPPLFRLFSLQPVYFLSPTLAKF